MKDLGKSIKGIFESLINMVTDTEIVAREFEREIKDRFGHDQQIYYRFNVQYGLEDVGLEEWDESDRTQVATRGYLRTQSDQIDRCVSQLWQPKST